MKRLVVTLVVALACFAFPALAWDGYDYDSGSYIEIEGGNLRASR